MIFMKRTKADSRDCLNKILLVQELLAHGIIGFGNLAKQVLIYKLGKKIISDKYYVPEN